MSALAAGIDAGLAWVMPLAHQTGWRAPAATSTSPNDPARRSCSKASTERSGCCSRSRSPAPSAPPPKETRTRLTSSSLTSRTHPHHTNRPPCQRRRTGGAGMTATSRRIHTRPIRKTTGAPTAGMVDTRACACARAGSQAALLRLRERDRLLRTDRRARPRRTPAHLAAQRADARRRPSRHARPLRAQRRPRSTRALTSAARVRHHTVKQ